MMDKWHIVEDSSITLDNWMKRWSMYCDSKFVISSFSMFFFLGYAIASLFIPSYSDRQGRKNWTVYTVLMQLGSELVIFLLPKARVARFVIIPMQFIHGFSTAG